MRKGSNVTPALFVLLALVTGSCGDKGPCSTCPNPDTTSPNVVLVSPEEGAVNVPVTGAVVTVTFSEPVDSTTVNRNTFVLTRMASAVVTVTGEITVSGATATLTPETPLEYSAVHAVVVTSGVKDMAGNALGSPYKWEFTTMQDPTLWTLNEEYQVKDVAADASGAYVTGATGAYTHDFFVVKFHLDGERSWLEEVATEDVDSGCGIAVSGSSIYIGRVKDPLGIGGADVYVDARDTETGALIWSTLVARGAICLNVTVYQQSVYIVGNFGLVELSAVDGGVVRTLTKDQFGGVLTGYWSVAVDDNTVYLGGRSLANLGDRAPVNGGTDWFLAAFDRTLSTPPRWVKQWGGPREEYEGNVAVSPDANVVYLAGYSGSVLDGEVEVVLLAYELNGNFLRSTVLAERAAFPSLASEEDGTLYVRMQTDDRSPMRVQPDGSIAWIGSPPTSTSGGIAVGAGTVYVTDRTNELVRYDAETGVKQ
ncbi:MAG: Ig-like domain-containing protein [Patescibacteria group bacterium]|nr:Ig-like domain-containing protein [Patescibacteria group bacterium]